MKRSKITLFLLIVIPFFSNGQVSLVKDFTLNVAYSKPKNFVKFGGNLFFTCETIEYGEELWKTDGTEAGTVLVKDIYPGSYSGCSYSSLVEVNGSLYFGATDGVNGYELWKSDGTTNGTLMVKDINPKYYQCKWIIVF